MSKVVVGIVIAMLVLMPEGLAALRAARANRLQTSLNLALGTSLACIGLTIPTVVLVSVILGWPLELGLDVKGAVTRAGGPSWASWHGHAAARAIPLRNGIRGLRLAIARNRRVRDESRD